MKNIIAKLTLDVEIELPDDYPPDDLPDSISSFRSTIISNDQEVTIHVVAGNEISDIQDMD